MHKKLNFNQKIYKNWTFWRAPRHLVQPEYDEFRHSFSRFFTAAVGVAFLKPEETLKAAGQESELIWWRRMPQKHKIASQLELGWGILICLVKSALCNVLTHFCESSGFMGSSGSEDSGVGAGAGNWRAERAWAAKSHAARTGQHRLRSRFLPQASLTPPKSSSERSRRQLWAWVTTGKAGTVLGWTGSTSRLLEAVEKRREQRRRMSKVRLFFILKD